MRALIPCSKRLSAICGLSLCSKCNKIQGIVEVEGINSERGFQTSKSQTSSSKPAHNAFYSSSNRHLSLLPIFYFLVSLFHACCPTWHCFMDASLFISLLFPSTCFPLMGSSSLLPLLPTYFIYFTARSIPNPASLSD